MTTIRDIAQEAEVSTATVSRVLNDSSKVSSATRKKVEQAVEKLEYSPEDSSREKDELTIKDVAEAAEVSEATVSRVLNNRSNVASKTKKKVESVIKDLGYTPNLNARGLRSKETKLVGLIIPDISNPVFAEIMKGIENLANSYDYNVVLLETEAELEKELACLQTLRDRRADGIIYMGNEMDKKREKALADCESPVVVVSREEEVRFPTININNYQAVYEMMEYLIKDIGYKKIGFISGPVEDITAGKKRYSAYKQALKDNGLRFNSDWVATAKFILSAGYKGAQEILKSSDRPEVIFAASDKLAVGAMQAVKEAGLEVPGDIGLVGFDNIELSRYVFPNLTTIGQPIYKLGTVAMEVMMKLIQGKDLETKDIYLDYELIIRDSTLKNVD